MCLNISLYARDNSTMIIDHTGGYIQRKWKETEFSCSRYRKAGKHGSELYDMILVEEKAPYASRICLAQILPRCSHNAMHISPPM